MNGIGGIVREDFTKARNRAFLQTIFNRLSWKNPDLLSLYEVTSIIKPKSECYLGMRTIEVKKIIGSEGRYHDFSAAFLPKKEMLRYRWERVDAARMKDVILPPISVYSLGGYYFVRDGNHRVSVARSQGVEFIDAEVVELDSQIKLEEGMTMRTLKNRVVAFERNQFLSQYRTIPLPIISIVFSTPGAYPEMVNHILVHKYYINMDRKEEISFEEAAQSWYDNVYSPIAKVIREEDLLFYYPGQTVGDIYMWLVKRWDQDKREKQKSLEEIGEEAQKESHVSPIAKWTHKLMGGH